ncbi:hypothetical protein VNO78_28967 [Psophocarpus tetragonolobus]|uniref:Uncharacterized protein n=1 Tax=Psophocarpus tetragonolobus TaxID=3891 RepID=A0AAN9WZK8_PSOTE
MGTEKVLEIGNRTPVQFFKAEEQQEKQIQLSTDLSPDCTSGSYPNCPQQKAKTPMAFSKAMFLAVMSVLVAVISAADAPAPAPASPSAAVSPSFVAGCVAAVAALAFGSALRI